MQGKVRYHCINSWRLTVIQIQKRQVFINLVNPVQSVISNSRRFHGYSRHVL